MLQTSFLFCNIFSSSKITPTRLYNFGVVVLGALKADNNTHQFDAIIEALTTALAALYAEMKGVDSNLSGQKIDTRTVDELIVDFYTCMSSNEGVIAKALGGKASAGFLTFYPNKQTEYSRATKKSMPLLTGRVYDAATKFADKLDAGLVRELSSFRNLFTEKYAVQQQKKVDLKKDRKERGTAFTGAQMALTSAVYTVGATYPGNPAKCQPFFPFAMLRPPHRRKRYMLQASLKENEVSEVVNHTLNKTAEMICANTGTNSRYAVWLAASPADPMPADAFIINAGAPPMVLKAARLGDLQAKPFVMVKNLSDVNTASYEITFVGLKKAIKGAVVSVENETTDLLVASA